MTDSLGKISALCALMLGCSSSLQAAAPPDDCSFVRSAIARFAGKGGEVVVPAGTYTCKSPIVLDQNHLTLRGEGSVTFRLADNSNSPVIVMGNLQTPPVPKTDIRVMNLNIDGNRTHQQIECWGGPCDSGGLAAIRNNGITVRGITGGRIENVFITSPRSGGVVTEHGTYGLKINGLSVTDSHFDGFAGYATYGSELSNMHLYKNRAAGISIDLHFNGNIIRDSTLEENGDVGVFMRDSSLNLFQNLTIVGSGNHGLFLSSNGDGSPTCPNDNDFYNLTVLRSGGVGFRLNDGCPGNRLTGSAIFRANRYECISEGMSGMLQVGGSLTCEH